MKILSLKLCALVKRLILDQMLFLLQRNTSEISGNLYYKMQAGR